MSIHHTNSFPNYILLLCSLFIGHKANNELMKLQLPAKAKVRLSPLQADLYLTPPSKLILIGLNFIGNDFQRYGGS